LIYLEWVHVVSLVIRVKLPGGFANVVRSEARAGPKTGAGVKRNAQYCHVRPWNVFDTRKEGERRETRIARVVRDVALAYGNALR
jgi:hypothetical protein